MRSITVVERIQGDQVHLQALFERSVRLQSSHPTYEHPRDLGHDLPVAMLVRPTR